MKTVSSLQPFLQFEMIVNEKFLIAVYEDAKVAFSYVKGCRFSTFLTTNVLFVEKMTGAHWVVLIGVLF